MTITIKKVNDFLRKNSLIIKILLSYIIVGVVLISILSFFLFNSYSKNSLDEINTISLKMLSQSYNVSDTILTSVHSYFWQLYSKNSQVFNALYSKTFDTIETGGINKLLVDEVSANPWLYSLYIYNNEASLVFSNLSTVKSVKDFYDQDIINIINRKSLDQGLVIIPRKVEYKINDKITKINLLTVVFAEYSNIKKTEAALVVNINQEELQKILSRNGEDDVSSIFIINKDGIVISHPDSSEFSKNVSDKQYIARILEEKGKEGVFSTEVNGVKCLVSFIKSGNSLEWSFISIGEYKNLLRKVKSLQGSILLITSVFVLLGILIAVVFASRIYIPLYKLIRKMKSNGVSDNAQISLSEYDYLNSTFDILVKDVKHLSSALNNAKPAQKKEVLRQLVLGETVWGKNAKKQLEILNIQPEAAYYVVCVLSIDSFEEFCKKYSLNEIGLFRFAMGNIVQEVMEAKFKADVDESGADHLSVVLALGSNNDGVLGRAKEEILRAQYYIKEYLDFTVTVSIGSIAEEIKDIHRSYEDALLASRYRIIHGKNSLIMHSNITKLETEPYVYPYNKEKQLVDCMKLGERDRVEKILNEITDYVKKFSYDEILLALMQLALSTVRSIEGITDVNREELSMDYKNIFKKLSSFDTLEEIKEWFKLQYLEAIDFSSNKKDRKKEEIVEKLEQYIENNYQNPNLTVEMVADVVSLSPNYVRAIFKSHINESLSNYISQVRFEKAKELLIKTDYPANRISEMVGFQSSGYFYVNFKKFTGKSPDQFRKEF